MAEEYRYAIVDVDVSDGKYKYAVHINDHGKPVCPLCKLEGDEFAENGQSAKDPHLWVWSSTGVLEAAAHRR